MKLHFISGHEGPGSSSLDIVLVHGPGQTIDRCWATESSPETPKYMWLKEFVDQEKNIRLLEFNYDDFDKNPNPVLSPEGIKKVSKRLAECLDESRKHSQERSNTPIALVAHSIGGIFIKEALVYATITRTCPSFLERCKLLVFFDTPHRALTVNPWKDILTNLLLAPTDNSSLDKYGLAEGKIESLSMYLDNLSIQFINISPRQRIMNIVGNRSFTNRYSYSTGLVHEVEIIRDHEGDAGKISVNRIITFYPILDRFRTEIAKEDDQCECKSRQYDACLYDLAKLAPPFVVPHEAQRVLLGDDHLPAEFHDWLGPRSPPVITVPIPGIAEGGRRAAQLFRETQWCRYHAYYFSFPTIDATGSSVTGLVASLAFQIMARHPERFDRVRYFYLAMKKKGWLLPSTLTTLFRLVLDTKSTVDPIHIILDGLHRCNSSRQIIEILHSIFKDQEDSKMVRLALFYQENNNIEKLLGEFGAHRMHYPLSGRDPTTLNTNTQAKLIRLDNGGLSYCQDFMLSHSTRRRNPTEDILIAEAEDEEYNERSQLMESLSAKLDRDILDQISTLPEWAPLAFGWILHSKRPLSYDELASALAITGNEAEFTAPKLNSRFYGPDFASELPRTFGFLLTTETGGISFSTDRIRRLWQESFASQPSDSEGKGIVIPGEPEIATILLQYLSHDGFRDLIGNENRPWDHPPSYRFLCIASYATQFWAAHYREAERMDPSNPGILGIIHKSVIWGEWPDMLKLFNEPATWQNHDITIIPTVAAQLGLTSIFTEELLDRISSESWKSTWKLTLDVASYYGHRDMVAFLLERAPRHKAIEELTSALLEASIGGHRLVMDLILTFINWFLGFELNDSELSIARNCQWPRIQHSTLPTILLERATELGDETLVHRVLDDYEIPEDEGPKLLELAAHYGHASIVRMLLDYRHFKIDPSDNIQLAPIIIAAKAGHHRVIEHLLPLYEKTDVHQSKVLKRAMEYATSEGHETALAVLFEQLDKPKGHLFGQDRYFLGELVYLACNNKQFEVAKYLLQYESKPGLAIQDLGEHTVLFYAVDLGVSWETVAIDILRSIHDDLTYLPDGPAVVRRAAELGLTLFLERCLVKFAERKWDGWREEYVDDKQRDAVHYAAKAGRLDVVRLLAKYNIKCDRADNDDCTPLALAAAAGHRELVIFLMGCGPDSKEDKVRYYVRAVNYACQHAPGGGDIEILKLLLEGRSDPNAMDLDEADSNVTPTEKPKIKIGFALSRSSLDVIQLLTQHGADIKSQSEDGQTALHFAASNPHSDARKLCELLIAEGHSPSHIDVEGQIPFHYAAHGGNTEVLELLMGYGQDMPHFRAKDGRTALHFAIRKEKSLEWLLQRGADANAVTNGGKTALMLLRVLDPRVPECENVILAHFKQTFFEPGCSGRTPLY